MISIVSALRAVAVFGFVKGTFTGVSRVQSALQTVLVGGLATGVAAGPVAAAGDIVGALTMPADAPSDVLVRGCGGGLEIVIFYI